MLSKVSKLITKQNRGKGWLYRHISNTINDDESVLMPNEEEFSKLLEVARSNVINDVFNWDTNTQAQCGTGYKWVHSNDVNELSQQNKIYHIKYPFFRFNACGP